MMQIVNHNTSYPINYIDNGLAENDEIQFLRRQELDSFNVLFLTTNSTVWRSHFNALSHLIGDLKAATIEM